MAMEIIINFMRPGKGMTRYLENLVDENPVRIKTISLLSPEISQRWCEENWWLNGYIHHGRLVTSVVKYLFYRRWYSIMQLYDVNGDHLGYYVDICTPFRKVGNEVYLTDLFLDLWINPDGSFIELDREEFEEAFRSQLISAYQHRKANQVIKMIVGKIARREFFQVVQ